jgi:hypothetical protein
MHYNIGDFNTTISGKNLINLSRPSYVFKECK